MWDCKDTCVPFGLALCEYGGGALVDNAQLRVPLGTLSDSDAAGDIKGCDVI